MDPLTHLLTATVFVASLAAIVLTLVMATNQYLDGYAYRRTVQRRLRAFAADRPRRRVLMARPR